jgi:hypothetical protein
VSGGDTVSEKHKKSRRPDEADSDAPAFNGNGGKGKRTPETDFDMQPKT